MLCLLYVPSVWFLREVPHVVAADMIIRNIQNTEREELID